MAIKSLSYSRAKENGHVDIGFFLALACTEVQQICFGLFFLALVGRGLLQAKNRYTGENVP